MPTYLHIFEFMFKHIQGVYVFRQESELCNYELADNLRVNFPKNYTISRRI